MPKTLDKPTSLGLLDRLDQKDLRRKISGAGAHQYKLNPPLLISVIEAFEKQQGGSLPGDYRSFITEFRKELSQNNVAKNWGFCILLL